MVRVDHRIEWKYVQLISPDIMNIPVNEKNNGRITAEYVGVPVAGNGGG